MPTHQPTLLKAPALRGLPGLSQRRRQHGFARLDAGLNPRLLSVFDFSYGVFGRRPPGATARQIGDVGDVALVLVIPEYFNQVFLALSPYFSIIAANCRGAGRLEQNRLGFES